MKGVRLVVWSKHCKNNLAVIIYYRSKEGIERRLLPAQPTFQVMLRMSRYSRWSGTS